MQGSVPGIAAADSWLCFEACVPQGALRLQVRGPATCNAAVAAIVLDDCDDLLQAIDSWLAIELDWKWAGEREAPDRRTGPSSPSAALANCAPSGDCRDVDPAPEAFGRCRLEVPWLLIRTVRPPPPALARRLRWQDAPARLTLSTRLLDDAELSAIEPGGAVALPESMRSGWSCRLHAPDEAPERGIAVAVETPATPARAASSTASSIPAPLPSGGTSVCQVLLPIPRPLGASFLAGWSVPPLSVNDLTNRRTEFWLVPPGTGAPPRRIAAGSLIPWGQGCALLVEDCQ